MAIQPKCLGGSRPPHGDHGKQACWQTQLGTRKCEQEFSHALRGHSATLKAPQEDLGAHHSHLYQLDSTRECENASTRQDGLALPEKVILGMAEILGLSRGDRATATRKGEESREYLDTYCDVIEAQDHDATWLSYSTGLARVRDDWGVDKYGRGFMLSKNGIPAVMEGGVKSMDDLNGYRMADRVSIEDFEGAAYVIDKLGRDRSHVLSMNGPF